ncbi:hypothetical protein [Pollutibacter soli]|uniref:hypothetical protein n=1 Tax=Pollutibacter soli TaxID=3034157 RepID=UPI00301397A0
MESGKPLEKTVLLGTPQGEEEKTVKTVCYDIKTDKLFVSQVPASLFEKVPEEGN